MSIETRLIEAAKQQLTEAKVYSELEKLSGIKADSWRKVAAGKQRATSEMIEWGCQEWPHYAFWIASGVLPNKEDKHTTPECTRLIALEIKLETLLSKEPINWTQDECSLLDLWIKDEKNEIHNEISARTLNIYLKAKKERKLLKRVIAEAENELLKNALKDPEIEAILREKNKGLQADEMTFEELADFEQKELEKAVKEIENYRDKKIK